MSSNGNSSEEVEGFYSVFNAISAPQGVVLGSFFSSFLYQNIRRNLTVTHLLVTRKRYSSVF